MLTALYRGVVVRNDDPEGLQRVIVQIPQVFGDQITDWCWPQLHPGSRVVPQPGETVWIQFEGGDPERPIWLGVWHTIGGAPGSFSVPLHIYVGMPAPAVLPPYPGYSMPTTSIQETADGTATVTAQSFVTTGAADVQGNLSAPTADIFGNVTVGGTATTAGISTGTLAAGTTTLGATTVTGTLAAGATTLGATTINGNTTINGTLTATSIVGLITIDTLAADYSASAPGDNKSAGATGKAADAGHKHSRESWGISTDITSSEPHDAASAGATGHTADAGHQHARNLSECVYLGAATVLGPFGGSPPVVQGTNWADISGTASVSVTKRLASTKLLIWWSISGYILDGVSTSALFFGNPPGVEVPYFRIKIVGGGTTFSGNVPQGFNAVLDHRIVSSWQEVTGIAGVALTITMQINTQSMTQNGGNNTSWRWGESDLMNIVAWEA